MNGLILLTVLSAIAGAEASRVSEGKPLAPEPVIGGFVLGICLFVFAMANAQITKAFCILIIATSLLLNGVKVFNLTNTAIQSKG